MDPFISRDDLADYLHRPDGSLDDDDAALQAVDAASDWIRTETGQVLDRVTDETIALDGSGTDALLLPQLPVVEVSAVLVDDGELEADGWTLSDDGILLRPFGFWRRGRNNVEVTYTHGYLPPDFPRDLRMVALRLAARFYSQPVGVVFESLGARSVRYETDAQGSSGGGASSLTAAEKRIVRKFARKRRPSRRLVTS